MSAETIRIALNGRSVACTANETILEVCRREGEHVPTLCEFAALNHRPGTCRMCLVEIGGAPLADSGKTRLTSACNTRVVDGMTVETRSRRVRDARRLQAELLFADHCERCSGCARHGDCELQTVASEVGLDVSALSGRLTARPSRDDSAPALIFTADKCIRCMRCIEVCRTFETSAITFEGTGVAAVVGFDGAPWGESNRCVQCGQCSLVCPTGAIAVRDETDAALDWFCDPEIFTVVQIAPAVRVAMGEVLGLPAGANLEGALVAGLKRLGADLVCDTRWAADVTILEEGAELIERLKEADVPGAAPLPMFTSCCPGWVNHVEKSHPDMIPRLSTTRSPQGIFSALAKTWLARERGLDPARIRVVSVMPCTAKKDEAGRAQLAREGVRDTDLVLTVRELAHLFERFRIDAAAIAPEPFDSAFMTEASGAAQLFGTTGGVMEAALRYVVHVAGGAPLPLEFAPVRGLSGVKEASVDAGSFGRISVAVVHGLANLDPVLERVRSGRAPWRFIEVMACPGGCIGGGGTSRGPRAENAVAVRQEAVYAIDRAAGYRRPDENSDVRRLYAEFLGSPGSHAAHELLHCVYRDRRQPKPSRRFRLLESKIALTDKH